MWSEPGADWGWVAGEAAAGGAGGHCGTNAAWVARLFLKGRHLAGVFVGLSGFSPQSVLQFAGIPQGMGVERLLRPQPL